ncbi:hypothetical protein BH23ACT9_BH23ACT9_33010 [soil metagenome]
MLHGGGWGRGGAPYRPAVDVLVVPGLIDVAAGVADEALIGSIARAARRRPPTGRTWPCSLAAAEATARQIDYVWRTERI